MEQVIMEKTKKRQSTDEVDSLAPPAKRVPAGTNQSMTIHWDELCFGIRKGAITKSAEVTAFVDGLGEERQSFIDYIIRKDLVFVLLTGAINDINQLVSVIRVSKAFERMGVQMRSVVQLNNLLSLIMNSIHLRDVPVNGENELDAASWFAWLFKQKISPLAMYAAKEGLRYSSKTPLYSTLNDQTSRIPLHERAIFHFVLRHFGNPIICIDVFHKPITLIHLAVIRLGDYPDYPSTPYELMEAALYSIYRTTPDAMQWDRTTQSRDYSFSSDDVNRVGTLIRQLMPDPTKAMVYFSNYVSFVPHM
jgi:hypothetical protein